MTPLKYDEIIAFGKRIEESAMVNIGGELYKGDAQNIHFSSGKYTDLQGGKFGLVDSTGKEIVPPIYDGIDDFREGMASVEVNNKFGFINKSGEVIIPLKYDFVYSSFYKAKVKLNGEEFYIDKTGKRID